MNLLFLAILLSTGQAFLENTDPSESNGVTCRHRIVMTSLKPTHKMIVGEVSLAPAAMACFSGQTMTECGSKEVDHIEVTFMRTQGA